MVFGPTVNSREFTLSEALPPESVAVPSEAPSNRNVTSPVGVPPVAFTAAVSFTLPPLKAMLAGAAVTAVLLAGALVQLVASL